MRALRISLAECTDLAAVETRWRALEARSDGSFFRSWAWVGCLARERFSRPVLLEATWRGRVVALGLLNRRGWLLEPDTLWLGESGMRDLDAVFVEHNGLLVERGWSGMLERRCLEALVSAPLGGRGPWRGRRVVLSGLDSAVADGLRRRGDSTAVSAVRPAPFVDLTSIPLGGEGFVGSLSANTRQQIRRSNRRYQTKGDLHLTRAQTSAQAHVHLDALASLHQQAWQRRGKPGAFANPAFTAFHHALIDRGFADGAIDLMRVAAGRQAVGYLYNFRVRGRVSAYQSGFAYEPSEPHLKPGLTCHALAIEQALSSGCTVYDFLAGDSQYKRSLSNATTTMCWVELAPRCSPRAVIWRWHGWINARRTSSRPTPTP